MKSFNSYWTVIKIFFHGIFILCNIVGTLSGSQDSNSNRLPDDVIPLHYTINLIPHIEENNFTYDGESHIEIEVKTESNLLILHAYDLQINGKITLENESKTFESIHEIDDKNDFLKITFKEKLSRGHYILHLKYHGIITDQPQGFYRSYYIDNFGKKQWLLSTYFEAMHARRAFPCWDEPAFKATFKISIKHNRRYTALSNTQFNSIISANDSSNQVWTNFEKTPAMSTYLVAFIIGDLDYLAHNDDESFRVWTRKNSPDRGNHLLTSGLKAFRSLEDFIGIPYEDHGLKKIDLVLIPQQTSIGMENWGIIFLKENEFIYSNDNVFEGTKRNDFMDLTHELTHQWFGNFVTHKWWDCLWLTEGFASYLSYLINDRIEKSWRVMDKFVLDRREDLFTSDFDYSLSVINADKIFTDLWSNRQFKINYYKSGVIIRMINYVLGEENFRTGLRNYLRNNKFGSVTSRNLFEEFGKVSGDMNVTFVKALNNWANAPGYPMVTINRNYTSNRATITQSHFSNDRFLNSSTKFWIALNIATEDNPDFSDTSITHWFDPDSVSLEISAPEQDKWLISNKQQFGYYRVNYDERNWKLIINFLKSKNYHKIHYLNRAQLIDDAFVLAELRHVSYSIGFELMEYLRQETDYLPWATFLGKIRLLHGKTSLSNSPYYETFKRIVLTLFENLEKDVFFDRLIDDDFIKMPQKKSIIKWTCTYGSSLCKNYTLSMITKWLEDPEKNALDFNLKSEILCGGIRYADKSLWNELLTKCLNDKDKDILNALSCTLDDELLHKLLSMAMNNSLYEIDTWNLFLAITMENKGLEATLNFVNNSQIQTARSDDRYNFLHDGIIFMRYNVRNNDHFSKWREVLINVIGEEKAKKYLKIIGRDVDNYNIDLESMKNYFEKKGFKNSPA
ncbi:aminopeptidase N-like [Microplitis mediator]|uniref:aminopeptidase N-like n=1 Tax=Microplitis mediator TaxID=375433 RepID=UPI0025563ECD|nr:aminopeptidase N-like [Microplitis mediator]